MTADLAVVTRAFGLGEVMDTRYLSAGLMNRNWRMETRVGTFVLKRIVDVALPVARRNLNVLATLNEDGIPACPPVLVAGGDPVIEVGGRGYCVFPWLEGCQPQGAELSGEQVAGLGALLGQIHRSLNSKGRASLPAKPATLRARVTEPASALAEADGFLAHIARSGSSEHFDLAVAEFLERRKVLLNKYEALRPVGEVPQGPFGWTHGDFQHLNVIWCDGRVVGVIDWDRLRVRPFGEEVARSATLLFGRDSGELDLGRVSAFVAGYRSVIPLRPDDLVDAVDRLWWKRMCDYWHLEFHYERDDHSCDHLFWSASRFLEWWVDHLDEVRAAFATGPRSGSLS